MSLVSLLERKRVLSISAAFSAAWWLCVACSSSSSSTSSASPPVFCEGPFPVSDGLSSSCDCIFLKYNKEKDTPNDAGCSAASLGPGAICSLSPSTADGVDTGCACFSFDCGQAPDQTAVTCGYWIGSARPGPKQEANLKHVDPSACVGQHHCFSTTGNDQFGGVTCTCQDATCPDGTQDLASCTDSVAQGMLRTEETFSTDIAVSDCRVPSSTLDGGS